MRAHKAREIFGHFFNHCFPLTLNHDPKKRLRPGIADQDTTAPIQPAFTLTNRPVNIGH
jgi:hypothetical protein